MRTPRAEERSTPEKPATEGHSRHVEAGAAAHRAYLVAGIVDNLERATPTLHAEALERKLTTEQVREIAAAAREFNVELEPGAPMAGGQAIISLALLLLAAVLYFPKFRSALTMMIGGFLIIIGLMCMIEPATYTYRASRPAR